VLGKLIVTAYELIFEPFNELLKGHVDQLSEINSGRLLRQRPLPDVS
jgi:hypothetical protein